MMESQKLYAGMFREMITSNFLIHQEIKMQGEKYAAPNFRDVKLNEFQKSRYIIYCFSIFPLHDVSLKMKYGPPPAQTAWTFRTLFLNFRVVPPLYKAHIHMAGFSRIAHTPAYSYPGLYLVQWYSSFPGWPPVRKILFLNFVSASPGLCIEFAEWRCKQDMTQCSCRPMMFIGIPLFPL